MPAALDTNSTRPYFCSRMMFHAARVTDLEPYKCTLTVRSQSFSDSFWNDTSRKMPALLTTMSTRPHASMAVLMILSPNSTES